MGLVQQDAETPAEMAQLLNFDTSFCSKRSQQDHGSRK